MRTIRNLLAPPTVTGRIEAIIVRGDPRQPAQRIDATMALPGFVLADDRLGRRGEAELSTRQVTLIQAEHLDVIARLTRVPAVDRIDFRSRSLFGLFDFGKNQSRMQEFAGRGQRFAAG